MTPFFRGLDFDDPPPFEVREHGTSPFVFICDHAGRKLPEALGSLGLPESELVRHIAWDIGARGLSLALAERLDAWAIWQTYSRLVIDCNRPLTSPDSIATHSEDTIIVGNLEVSATEAALRAAHIFEPYHARIRQELDERAANGRASILLFVHSFTPTYRRVDRPFHAGVLYHTDDRVALPLLEALRQEPGLVVGDNEPYRASPLTDYGLIEHAEKRGLPYVELEVRQDLIADAEGQAQWTERLARLLVALPLPT
jgi:predicted N-formylglutamate amidohydrolase